MPLRSPEVSFVLATFNRREVAAHTLTRILQCGLDRCDYEVIVVDNASSDGTPDVVADVADRVIRLDQNMGSCAKAVGTDHARGRYIVFLDDDSYPRPGSVSRMIRRFEEDPRLAAAGYTVCLHDGRREGSALPGVFVGCGVGLRSDVLQAVGGLDRTFFMQAEEYDLCFRLVSAGWGIGVFEDVQVEHLKSPAARRSDRTTFLDVRNNLRVVERYLPDPYRRIYRKEFIQRYKWLAERDGHRSAWAKGVVAGRWLSAVERLGYRSHRLGPDAFERLYCWERVRAEMAGLARSGVCRVVLADLGKNCYPFVRGAELAGITVRAIGDDRFCAPKRVYRGVPILPEDEALKLEPDAYVVANTGAVHAAATHNRLMGRTSRPVHCWFSTPDQTPSRQSDSQDARYSADDNNTTTERIQAAEV
ncbi:MAG: glycosyltransferase [Phycisphaerales bacterium]|nr:MAG: glycosyltransferase [Phycisphaerales bacterium]